MSDQYAPPSGPPPSYHSREDDQRQQHHVQFAASSNRDRELASNNPFRNAYTPSSSTQAQHPSSTDEPPDYAAPPGPPPRWTDKKGSSVSHGNNDEYAPPPGPPPKHGNSDEYIPPPGPPPGHSSATEPEAPPPPYDPWLAVPDNALLPPPPSIKEERSPGANADYDDAARAHAWCRANPLWQPRPLPQETLSRMASGRIALTSPPNNTSRQVTLRSTEHGTTHIKTSPRCTDSIFLSDIPLYAASIPIRSPRTVYYELRVISLGTPHHHSFSVEEQEIEAGLALGFTAPPYPAWRLPGWHRASLAIHSDDGRRYVDNSFGGQPFTEEFRPGDIVGIGMTFTPTPSRMQVGVFFTRNGKREGGWDLHEERDQEQEEGDVTGLEGKHDLLASVGCFGAVEFEARFRREEWVFRP